MLVYQRVIFFLMVYKPRNIRPPIHSMGLRDSKLQLGRSSCRWPRKRPSKQPRTAWALPLSPLSRCGILREFADTKPTCRYMLYTYIYKHITIYIYTYSIYIYNNIYIYILLITSYYDMVNSLVQARFGWSSNLPVEAQQRKTWFPWPGKSWLGVRDCCDRQSWLSLGLISLAHTANWARAFWWLLVFGLQPITMQCLSWNGVSEYCVLFFVTRPCEQRPKPSLTDDRGLYYRDLLNILGIMTYTTQYIGGLWWLWQSESY